MKVHPKAQNEDIGARFVLPSSFSELIRATGPEIKNFWFDYSKSHFVPSCPLVVSERNGFHFEVHPDYKAQRPQKPGSQKVAHYNFRIALG